jgi:hypothetical protein
MALIANERRTVVFKERQCSLDFCSPPCFIISGVRELPRLGVVGFLLLFFQQWKKKKGIKKKNLHLPIVS